MSLELTVLIIKVILIKKLEKTKIWPSFIASSSFILMSSSISFVRFFKLPKLSVRPPAKKKSSWTVFSCYLQNFHYQWKDFSSYDRQEMSPWNWHKNVCFGQGWASFIAKSMFSKYNRIRLENNNRKILGKSLKT